MKKESCSTIWADSKAVFEPYTPPLKLPILQTKKVKNDPKIKSKSKVRVKGIIDNESFSTTSVDPKTIFLTLTSTQQKLAHQGLKYLKIIPKTSQNKKLQLKKTRMTKVNYKLRV